MKIIFLGLLLSVFIIMSTANVFAGNFVQDAYGIKYDVGEGRYLENGNLTKRISQRFIELKNHSISFAPNQNIEFRIPVINDYYEEYVRRVYVFNVQFY